MRRKEKQAQIYFRLDSKLAQKLDKRIARAGYTSRSDFFTSVAYVALYGVESVKNGKTEGEREKVAKLPDEVTSWVSDTLPRITEDEILLGLHVIIEEILLPVIAMKGVDIAYENTWEDIRDVFHSRTGIWATESDVWEAYVSFAAIRKTELADYRENQLKNKN